MDTQDKSATNKKRDIYGSFSLSGTEFAISVESTQEVVNEPEGYTRVPLCSDNLLGLFNLRGIVIPVVDLRKIFNFPLDEFREERKIAIIEHGESCIGLLFDFTSEVFNGNKLDRSDFHQSAEMEREQIVQGVFKMDEGERIIQILNPYGLLNLKRIPRSDNSAVKSYLKRKSAKRHQCISFYVDGSNCALGIGVIQEIVAAQNIDKTALSHDLCLGALNVRGSSVPVIDLKKILNIETQSTTNATPTNESRIIIMRLENELFGLLIDSVESICSYYDEELVQFPVLESDKQEVFKGCISRDGKLETILLDHDALLSDKELMRITRGHSRLYHEKMDAASTLKAQGKDVLRTYISFHIDGSYALEISEVMEVVDYPKAIIVPPNKAKNCIGMFDLRGSLIPIIDPRLVYSLGLESRPSPPKLLILKAPESLFALVVDSVDSIISFHDSEKVKLPQILYSAEDKNAPSQDIKDAFQYEEVSELKKTILVLNLDAVITRMKKHAA